MTNENAVNSIVNAPQKELPLTPTEIPTPPQDTKPQSKVTQEFVKGPFTNFLYTLGVLIVFVGIFFLLVNYWDSLSPILRVISFFGTGIIFSAIGSFILHKKNYLGLVFHSISAFLIVIGGFVAFSEIASDKFYFWPFGILFLTISLFYLLLALYHKHEMLSFISVLLGILAFFSFVLSNLNYIYQLQYKAQKDSISIFIDLIERFCNSGVFLGFTLVLIGYLIRNGWNERLRKFLYPFGALFVFGFGLIFKEISFYTSFLTKINLSYEIFYGIYIIIGFLGAVFLVSKSILIVSAIGTISFILSIITKLFANDTRSWPILLIFLGVLVIAIGYLSYYIDQRFIKNKKLIE